jgi:hypothetical protein
MILGLPPKLTKIDPGTADRLLSALQAFKALEPVYPLGRWEKSETNSCEMRVANPRAASECSNCELNYFIRCWSGLIGFEVIVVSEVLPFSLALERSSDECCRSLESVHLTCATRLGSFTCSSLEVSSSIVEISPFASLIKAVVCVFVRSSPVYCSSSPIYSFNAFMASFPCRM